MSATEQYRTALVVGCDANTVHVIRYHLGKISFHIRTAADGWEALRRFQEGPVDLVLCEIALPDTDGLTLRQKLLAGPGAGDVPFVFLGAGREPEKEVRALRSGVDDYIAKPFDPIVLVARVEAALVRHRVREEAAHLDPLTRLPNRVTMQKQLSNEVARLLRYGRSAALCALDIDGLGDIAAKRGPKMGDLLLTTLAGMLTTGIRNMDQAGRYGPAGFMVCLPETGADGARILMDRLRDSFMSASEAILGERVAFSAGIVEAPADGGNVEQLCEHAMAALANARKSGGLCLWRDYAEGGVKTG